MRYSLSWVAAVMAVGLVSLSGLAGCGSPGPGSGSSDGVGPFDAIVAVSDYTSSDVGAIALDGGSDFPPGAVDLGLDPALSLSQGRVFFIARDIGIFFELDPSTGRALPGGRYSANDPDHAGTSNPYDVAVAPDGTLWVVRYDVPTLLILGADGSRVATIDLSSYDTDGNPQASNIRIVGSDAYVTLQRLDPTLVPDKPSMMLKIDTTSRKVVATLTLVGWNAFDTSQYDTAAGVFYVAESGSFASASQPNAGIEVVDVASLTSRMLVSKDALGATPAEIAVTTGCGIVIVAGDAEENPTSLLSFDPATGTQLQALANPILPTSSGYFLQALLWLGSDVLLVGDGDVSMAPASKLHVFDRTGVCTLTERPATMPLPLKAIALAPAASSP